MAALPDCYVFCAGDECLFAIEYSAHEGGGSVFKFCPAARSWTVVVSSNPINNFCLLSWVYHGGHLYGTVDDCVQSLTVSTGQWEALPPLSTPRVGATPWVLDGRLFVVGGHTASVEEYMAAERRWVSVPDMPRAVSWVSAVELEGKLLVIGGRRKPAGNRSGPTCAVLEYNPAIAAGRSCPACSLRVFVVP